MAKIGVLVFSGNNQIKVGRDGRTNYSFDGIIKRGINKIISEIDGEVAYCSTMDIDNYDHVLVSLTSYHDVLNLINNVPIKRKAKIHIGGPACNNINPILPYIDSANFGRCDCGKINDILNGKEISSVWQKKDDKFFEGEYKVDTSSPMGLANDEKSFGCRQKCAFCFYSHWNGFVEKNETKIYESGFSKYEDFFQTLDWHKAIRGAVTALDGTTEKTRKIIRKPLTIEKIKEILIKSNSINTETRLRVKVYSIVGYPWDKENEINNLDLVNATSEVISDIKNKITIRMHFSHFIPFQKTPMWHLPFNFNNYRSWCIKNKMLYNSEKIRIFSGGTFTPSPSSAAVSTIIQRARKKDLNLIRQIASKKYTGLSSFKQILFLKKHAFHLLKQQEMESIPNIKTSNKIIKLTKMDELTKP